MRRELKWSLFLQCGRGKVEMYKVSKPSKRLLACSCLWIFSVYDREGFVSFKVFPLWLNLVGAGGLSNLLKLRRLLKMGVIWRNFKSDMSDAAD